MRDLTQDVRDIFLEVTDIFTNLQSIFMYENRDGLLNKMDYRLGVLSASSWKLISREPEIW